MGPKQLSLLINVKGESADTEEVRAWLDRGVDLGIVDPEEALNIVRDL